MSGPIVRKYGFPNFDNIFGKRELEHGADEASETAASTAKAEKEGEKPTTPPSKDAKSS